jgi:hypothetical protein
MRRDSWRSVPMMCRPPAADAPGRAAACQSLCAARRSRALLVGLGSIRPACSSSHLALDVAAEHDVGAAAGHVGGDGDRRRAAGLRDDLGLALVLLGVEHLVRRCRLLAAAPDSSSEFSIEVVPTSTGWPRVVAVLDVVDDGVELLALRSGTTWSWRSLRIIGRCVGMHHGLEAVDLLELVGLGVGRAGHAGELARTCGSSSGR